MEPSVRISVRVIPRSSHNVLEWEDGTERSVKARLKAPPVDGAANEALISLLAEKLGVSQRTISIIRGATARQKTIEINGLSLEEIERRLAR